jgi:uncharacterized coiled-coil protein SlyX
MKTSISPVLITFALLSFALVQNTQAVTPAPDGGYPGGNTAEGQSALLSLTTGGFNTAAGYLSLRSDTNGSFNAALGAGSLLANTGDNNTATGAAALLSNTAGSANTATGTDALFSNTLGSGNTAVGTGALALNVLGTLNTAIGAGALASNTIGLGNVALGAFAGGNVTTANNVICIGSAGANVNGTCFIGNIRGVTTQNANAIPVLIDTAGQLGTMSSSRRFKHEIKPMDKASEAILALKPVTFHYKSDTKDTPQFGLIAEEVAAVNPDLVVRDKNGEIYTVRYDAVNAMLLSEFLKEHRKVEAQQAMIGRLETTVAKQEKGLQVVTARLDEQASQIQKMSAQLAAASPSRGELEPSRPAPQVALNNP